MLGNIIINYNNARMEMCIKGACRLLTTKKLYIIFDIPTAKILARTLLLRPNNIIVMLIVSFSAWEE